MTIETEKYLTVRNGVSIKRIACDLCKGSVPMLTVSEAAQVAGTSSRQIFRLVEAGQLHFRETGTGLLVVCFNSLSAEKEKQLLRSK